MSLEKKFADILAQNVPQLAAALAKAVAAEILGSPKPAAPSPKPAPRAARKPTHIKRDMSCIAAGCKNQSKGPRYRYLCESHLKATPAQVKAWRKARAK